MGGVNIDTLFFVIQKLRCSSADQLNQHKKMNYKQIEKALDKRVSNVLD